MSTAAAWSESVSNAAIGATVVLIAHALVRFPTGALLSARWRPLEWAMITASIAGFFAALINGGIGGDVEATLYGPSPLRNELGGLADLLAVPFFSLLVLSILGAFTSLVIRFRRAAGEERQQVKWVAAATLFLGLTLLLTAIQESANATWGVNDVLLGIGLTSIPVAMAVAILKYRLYDIDVVISRSLTYGSLAVFIGAVYVGVVVGFGELLGQRDRASFGLSIAATALVAIAFQPVRTRVERLANRFVYGDRATPYEVLAQFARRASEVSDEELITRIPRLIVDGTGAARAALWIRSGDGFETASSWPEDSGSRRIQGTEHFADPEADCSVPMVHDGELLGGVSLRKARGEAVTPAEAELLGNLAGGLGLALRNTRLTAQLRQQVTDLEQSRDRLVSAADEARRSLEHDLDSGPQQQLVAVKVKLGPIRKMAEKQGAEKTARLLADIESQAGDAIQAVREFAGGIYPPLLEAEGLAVALGHQARKSALHVSIHAEPGRRYPRDVEAAVYFTVLEALQNTAKYAGETRATVQLLENGNRLLFEVRDEGAGFDPNTTPAGVGMNGMADRIDTVGGTWHVASSPGAGTVVGGAVPIREAAHV
jgi:signal transduction histidine kinase